MTIISGDYGGIVFHADRATTHLYSFHVKRNGTYYLQAYFDKVGYPKVIASGTSAPLKETTLIAVVAQGSRISLYENNQLVRQITDTTYTHGHIGMITLSGEVAFRDARVWTL